MSQDNTAATAVKSKKRSNEKFYLIFKKRLGRYKQAGIDISCFTFEHNIGAIKCTLCSSLIYDQTVRAIKFHISTKKHHINLLNANDNEEQKQDNLSNTSDHDIRVCSQILMNILLFIIMNKTSYDFLI